jgi:hypothetical protein
MPTAYAILSPGEMRRLEFLLAPVSYIDAVASQALMPIFVQIDALGNECATIFFDEDQINLIVAFTEWRPAGGWHNWKS